MNPEDLPPEVLLKSISTRSFYFEATAGQFLQNGEPVVILEINPALSNKFRGHSVWSNDLH